MKTITLIVFLGTATLFGQANVKSSQAKSTASPKSHPKEYALPDDLVKALSNISQFRLDRKVANVPEPVRAAFTQATKATRFSMADPGGRWEATDVIRDASLPRRRLSTLAIGSGLCLLFYERGGIRRDDNVGVFRMANGRAEAIWHAYVSPAVINPASLAKALKENDYQESPFF